MLLAGFAAGLLSAGCMHMPTVALDATPADMEVLAGRWAGEYSSAALGRRGSIEFELSAAEGQARGGVVMTPQNSSRPYAPASLGRPSDTSTTQPASQLLTIRFVRASSGEISGMLDPYWDPDRNCEAMSVFRGYLAKDAIEGTFTTRFDCGAGEASGTWRVTKQRK